MVHHCPIAHVHVEQGLYAVILLVEEVDLILHLLKVALVRLLLVLLRKLVDILTSLVKFAKAQDLTVPDLNSVIETSKLLLEPQMRLHQVLILVTQLVCTLIGTAKLVGPLLILDGHAARLNRTLVSDRAFGMFTFH